ncbi:MAG: ATP-binding protein, partial [Candidatus Aenigmatarchaeota archaeon]
FPDIIIEDELADKFFDEYIDLVVFRDLIERHQIKNVFVVRYLIKSLLSSFSKEFSVNKVFNDLKSQNIKISKKTLYNYLSYLEDTFFGFSLNKFSYSMKTSGLSISKAFINDTGLVNSVLTNFSENIGKLMENQVFLELLRKKYNESNIELFYWKDRGREVDFILKKGEKIRKLIQVCYSIEHKETKKREVDALIKSSKELNCENLIIITWDYEGEEKINEKKIKFIPLWKWLLN